MKANVHDLDAPAAFLARPLTLGAALPGAARNLLPHTIPPYSAFFTPPPTAELCLLATPMSLHFALDRHLMQSWRLFPETTAPRSPLSVEIVSTDACFVSIRWGRQAWEPGLH